MRFPLLTIIFLLLITTTIAQTTTEPGVSRQLADYRKAHITNPQYTLNLTIPTEKTTDIKAEETLTFNYKQSIEPLQLDFKEDPKRITGIIINGKPAEIKYSKEHLLLEPKYLTGGKNEIKLTFLAGNGALNRNDDYLYALFVPDRARTVFPCFYQPNLKAVFRLSIQVSSNWAVMANAPIEDFRVDALSKYYTFAPSDTLSTYLFSFVAGRFSYNAHDTRLKPELFFRETDTTKLRLSNSAVFKAHTDALNFLESWTQIPYPFQKMGFVAIPDFQFGGMEHPGVVLYKASSLFLDASATQEQIIARLNLISHETAHMWFGDLVTMDWFNDVWMKEVFANFMADKVTGSLMGEETFNLKFLTDHFPAAYGIDRTPGANPIRQELSNLKDAGSLYGNIIYHKAPIMMRQLELLMGKENFQNGLREYLKTYAYRNATWPDLIKILGKYTTQDLVAWNNTWVNQPGRPVFNYSLVSKNGKIKRFLLIQHAERGAPRTWPQSFGVTLFWGGQPAKTITVNMTKGVFDFKETEGMKRPAYILFNSGGEGYGLFPTDADLYKSIDEIQSPLQRTSAYISLYENMLAGRYIKPEALLNLYTKALGTEKQEMSLKQITGYISSIYWQFINQQTRLKINEQLESSLWQAMQQQTAANNKKILFSTYQNIYLSANARNTIYNVWKQQQPPAGVKLSEDDYTAMSFSLALRNDADTAILTQQYTRITNPDRQKRFQFIRPALSPDVKVRDKFFASLSDLKSRAKESNVITALNYLHHPLRQATSVKYLAKSLDMLETIQSTGDIFFPQSWLSSTFGSYQSTEAAHIVTEFLAAHPNYNEKLKAKIQQSTDNLVRASGKLLPKVVVIE